MDEMTLDRLIVENIADIDATSRRAREIGEAIEKEIASRAREWATANDYEASQDDDENFWLSSPSWKTKGDEDSHDFWFEWYNRSSGVTDAVEDEYLITSLCGAGIDSVGFRLEQQPHAKRQWKKFVQSLSGALGGTRFVIDDAPSIWLPVVVDRVALAKAVEDDQYDVALQPLIDALEQIKTHFALLDGLLSKVGD
tara:strand:- start:26 stop:616 length:591 start_codon:yes stop_codon:yes gene_type:complete